MLAHAIPELEKWIAVGEGEGEAGDDEDAPLIQTLLFQD